MNAVTAPKLPKYISGRAAWDAEEQAALEEVHNNTMKYRKLNCCLQQKRGTMGQSRVDLQGR